MSPSPGTRAVTFDDGWRLSVNHPTLGGKKRPRRLTPEPQDRTWLSNRLSSRQEDDTVEADQVIVDDDDIPFLPLTSPVQGPVRTTPCEPSLCVQSPLPYETFTKAGLVEHLKLLGAEQVDASGKEDAVKRIDGTITALEDVWEQRHKLDVDTLFSGQEVLAEDPNRYNGASYEVHDVLKNGQVRKDKRRHTAEKDPHRLEKVWEAIRVSIRSARWTWLRPCRANMMTYRKLILRMMSLAE
jgi:hypothetical protein